MAEQLTETTQGWAQASLANADVIAAHERNRYLHRVAIVGANAVKGLLDGNERRGQPTTMGYGRYHSLGPTRLWTPYSWTSWPVYLGETDQNELNMNHEFISLNVRGTLDTHIKTKFGKTSSNEELKGDEYTITRLMGNSAYSPTETISHPGKRPVHIDRNFSCRDDLGSINWSPEGMIADYDARTDEITVFMDELQILANAAIVQMKGRNRLPENWYRLEEVFEPVHVSEQLHRIAKITNENSIV